MHHGKDLGEIFLPLLCFSPYILHRAKGIGTDWNSGSNDSTAVNPFSMACPMRFFRQRYDRSASCSFFLSTVRCTARRLRRTGSHSTRIQHRIHASVGKSWMHACISGAGWLPAIIRKLFQGPCDMVRREAGCARAPGPEPPARAPEPASGQARLPRAARRSESTSETRTDVRASERQQKWLDGQ